MSRQLDLAMAVWNDQRPQLTTAILNMADSFAHGADDLNYLVDDGVFVPFYALSPAMDEYEQEHGNEDDEATFIGDVWIYVLWTADRPEYKTLINRLVEVQVFGL